MADPVRDVVLLRKALGRAIRRGHPWIFRDAIEEPPALPAGTVVEAREAGGRAVATGFWDPDSPIAVRVLEAGRLDDVEGAVRERLRDALRLRLNRLDLERTDAFRWIHGEGDRLPGVHVDLYGDAASVRFDGAGARAFYRGLGARLEEAARPLAVRTAVDRQSGTSLLGPAKPRDLVVRENGVRFEAPVGRGGKGGLYLDQRENRAEVGRRSAGRRVLNLFGYTGGFSLYAARGGAKSTDTVDIAKPALAAARRNFALNGLPLEAAGFHAADAFEFLVAAARRGTRWDLVVSDPPAFAPSQASLEKGLRAYARLHRLTTAVVASGGTLCAASCSSHVTKDHFLETVRAGARIVGRRAHLEQMNGAAFDHPSIDGFPEGDYLKFGIFRVT